MPFELGLAVAVAHASRRTHTWWVLESHPHRLQQSLSDLNGTDPYIHGGEPMRLLQAIDNMFFRPHQPDVPLTPVLDLLQQHAPRARDRYGSLYSPGAFRSLVFVATTLTTRLRQGAR
jgi:hypothetical protein